MKLGDINVNILQNLFQVIDNQGKNALGLFERFGLGDLLQSHPERRISIPRYMRLGEQAISLTGRHDIGLLMGEQTCSHHFGLMGLTATMAPTLGDALTTAIRYERLYSSNSRGHSHITHQGERTGFCFYSISPYNRFNYFVVDAVLGGWLSLLQEWSGLTLSELAKAGASIDIEFNRPNYAANYATSYQRWKLPVHFSADGNRLWLPKHLSQQPCLQHNPITYRQLSLLCEQQLQQILQGRSLAEQVGEIIAMNLAGQTPTLKQIAHHFNLQPWTLNRQLEAENTHFQYILDSTRKDLATRYIRDTQLSIGEISYLLGFSSSPAFQRAFKRWHDIPAGAFRTQQGKVSTVKEEK